MTFPSKEIRMRVLDLMVVGSFAFLLATPFIGGCQNPQDLEDPNSWEPTEKLTIRSVIKITKSEPGDKSDGIYVYEQAGPEIKKHWCPGTAGVKNVKHHQLTVLADVPKDQQPWAERTMYRHKTAKNSTKVVTELHVRSLDDIK